MSKNIQEKLCKIIQNSLTNNGLKFKINKQWKFRRKINKKSGTKIQFTACRGIACNLGQLVISDTLRGKIGHYE